MKRHNIRSVIQKKLHLDLKGTLRMPFWGDGYDFIPIWQRANELLCQGDEFIPLAVIRTIHDHFAIKNGVRP